VKAYFRRGVAKVGSGDDEAALVDLRAAAKLAPQVIHYSNHICPKMSDTIRPSLHARLLPTHAWTHAKLPQDGGIRKELAAVKARLAVVVAISPVVDAEAVAALSTAFSGALYADQEDKGPQISEPLPVADIAAPFTNFDGSPVTPEQEAEAAQIAVELEAKEGEADLLLSQAEELRAEGKYTEAVATCKLVFKCLRLGFHPEELVLQRFRARVLSAQCHTLVSAAEDTPEVDRGAERRKAREALKTALSYLDSQEIMDSGVIPADELELARSLRAEA
jgi:hypothetical protein